MQCLILTRAESQELRRITASKTKTSILIIIIAFCLFISGCATKPGIDLIGMNKGGLEQLLKKTPDSPLRVDILNELAYRESWNGGQKPLDYAKFAEDLANKIKYREGLVYVRCIWGHIYFLSGDFDKSRHVYEEALELAERFEYITGKAMAYNGIARYYQVRGEYARALDNFLKIEEICRNSSDKVGKRILAGAYYGLGALYYYDPEDYKEARKYFERYLVLGMDINDDIIKTSGYYTIGLQYESLGEYKDAEDCFKKCLSLSKEIGLIYNEANAYEGLGDVYVDLKDYVKALENYEKSYKLFLQTGIIFQFEEIKKRIGRLYNKMGDRDHSTDNYNKAIKFLLETLKVALEKETTRTVVGACEEIIKSYEALEDYQSTSHYYKILLDKKEFLRKNEMLKLEMIKNAEEERIKRTYLIIGLIGLSIALVVVLVLSIKLWKQMVKIGDQAKRLTDTLKIEKEISNHKDDLMNTVSHQYKTPLANIDSSVQVLKEYSSKLSGQEIENQFNKILSNLKKMARLIDQLSMFGKKFNPADYDLDTICRAIVEEIESNEGSKHIIEFDSSGYCGKVKLDKDIVEIMLQNLVNNSIKFSPEGSKITVQLLCDAGYVVIKVSDNGIGIPADYFKMPFERFNRGSNVGAIPGTGLGLSIVKRYADLHGGEISIDSQVNGGTTVTIKIPRNPHGNKGDHNE